MELLDLIAGIAAAALSAMGVGGGGLLVIYLTLIKGIEQRTAQGINLLFFVCAALASLAVQLRKGETDIKTASLFSLGGALGAYMGCRLSVGLSSEILRKYFGYFLIASSLVTARSLISLSLKKKKASKNTDTAIKFQKHS